MNRNTQQLMVLRYQFIFDILKIQYNSKIDCSIKIILKIGPFEQSTKTNILLKNSRSIINQRLSIQNQIIYSQCNHQYQNLKGIFKIHLITSKGQKLAGVVNLSLNQYVGIFHDRNNPIQKKILNCPDSNAKILFKVRAQRIIQEKKIDFNNFDELIEGDSKSEKQEIGSSIISISQFPNEQDSIISIQISERQKKQNRKDQIIVQLRRKYEIMQQQLKDQKEKIVKYEQKYNLYKKTFSEIEQAQFNLIKQYQKIKKNLDKSQQKVKTLTRTEEQNKKLRSQIQILKNKSVSNCIVCNEFKQQYQIKQKYYQEQLQVLQSILQNTRSQLKSLQQKQRNLLKKIDISNYKIKKGNQYQKIFCSISQNLNQLFSKLPISQPLPDNIILKIQNLKSPQHLKLYFDEYFQFIFSHLYIQEEVKKFPSINFDIRSGYLKSQSQLNEQIKLLKFNLIKQQKYNTNINAQFQEALQKIDQISQENQNLKMELDLYKSNCFENKQFDKKSIKSSAKDSILTPRFQQNSFGHNNYYHDLTILCKDIQPIKQIQKKQSPKSISKILKLTEQKKHLQQQLKNSSIKITQLQQKILRKQKQLRSAKQQNELHKQQFFNKLRLQTQLQNRQKSQIQQQFQLKQKMISNLEMMIDQMEQDIEELKEQIQNKNSQISQLKKQNNILNAKIFKQNDLNLQDKIKSILQNLDEQDVSESSRYQTQQLETKGSQHNQTRHIQHQTLSKSPNILDFKSQISDRLNALSLQFLRMKCFKVSKCKSQSQTKQILGDFRNIKTKIDDFSEYIKKFGVGCN